MYLWRNLPEGQLLAVLRWMQARREAGRPAGAGKAGESAAQPAEAAAPTTR